MQTRSFLFWPIHFTNSHCDECARNAGKYSEQWDIDIAYQKHNNEHIVDTPIEHTETYSNTCVYSLHNADPKNLIM